MNKIKYYFPHFLVILWILVLAWLIIGNWDDREYNRTHPQLPGTEQDRFFMN